MNEQLFFDIFISTVYVLLAWVWVDVSRRNAIKKCLKEFKYCHTKDRLVKARRKINIYIYFVLFRFLTFTIIIIYFLYPIGENDAPLFSTILIGASIVSVVKVINISMKIKEKSHYYSNVEWDEFYSFLQKVSDFSLDKDI